jgi:hypothetical protein
LLLRPGGKLLVARLLDADGYELDDRDRVVDVVGHEDPLVEAVSDAAHTAQLTARLRALGLTPSAAAAAIAATVRVSVCLLVDHTPCVGARPHKPQRLLPTECYYQAGCTNVDRGAGR